MEKGGKHPLLDLFFFRTSAGAAFLPFFSWVVLLSSTSLLVVLFPRGAAWPSFLRGARAYTLSSSGGNVYPCRSCGNIILSFFEYVHFKIELDLDLRLKVKLKITLSFYKYSFVTLQFLNLILLKNEQNNRNSKREKRKTAPPKVGGGRQHHFSALARSLSVSLARSLAFSLSRLVRALLLSPNADSLSMSVYISTSSVLFTDTLGLHLLCLLSFLLLVLLLTSLTLLFFFSLSLSLNL